MVQICELTLRVKHLPTSLNDSQKEDFMKHFGAQQVKVISSATTKQSVAYGKFASKKIAHAVLIRIHQFRVLDNLLCVEYAKKEIADSLPEPLMNCPTGVETQMNFTNYLTTINALNHSVGFHQPPPAYLRYNYPKSNRATINNISFALDAVPQFYYQVLHLMNRMNLPPPFSNAPVTPPNAIQQKTPKSESESELETDPESKQEQTLPIKRNLPQKKLMKRRKLVKQVQVATSTPGNMIRNINDVFENIELRKTDKIELKVTSDCLEKKQIEQSTSAGGETIRANDEWQQSDILTDDELAANRVPLKDLHVLPMFKDYHAGIPNSRLYVKNIAKSVTVADLERIFKRYHIEKPEDEVNAFEIKYMTEGRMKCQAFITLDTVELGQRAVKETNGYILKDKPIVVVFAKTIINKNK